MWQNIKKYNKKSTRKKKLRMLNKKHKQTKSPFPLTSMLFIMFITKSPVNYCL